MKLSILALGGGALATAKAYLTMTVFAPNHPEIHAKVINARDRAFVIGAESPSTFCGLDDASKCPAGVATLINDEMTLLASEVPGGQFIFVAPDGSISYPAAHSSLRPPGSQMGGFFAIRVSSTCDVPMTVLSWQSADGPAGLWACPTFPGVPLSQEAVLKASTAQFTGIGCVSMVGILVQQAGDDFGAWAYT